MGDITSSYSLTSGKWNLAITGIVLLSYMIIHLFQFRFGATQPYKVRPPPYMINLFELPHLFFTTDESVPFVEVRDIYKLEFDIFKSPAMVAYYLAMVLVFMTHYMLGWAKVVPSSQLNIPKKYHWQVTLMATRSGPSSASATSASRCTRTLLARRRASTARSRRLNPKQSSAGCPHLAPASLPYSFWPWTSALGRFWNASFSFFRIPASAA